MSNLVDFQWEGAGRSSAGKAPQNTGKRTLVAREDYFTGLENILFG